MERKDKREMIKLGECGKKQKIHLPEPFEGNKVRLL